MVEHIIPGTPQTAKPDRQQLLLRQQILAARADLARRAGPLPDLETLQREMTARAEASAPRASSSAPIAAVLPAAVQAAARVPVHHGRLWLADLVPTRGRSPGWLKWATKAASRRAQGDPLRPTIVRVAGVLHWRADKDRTGWSRMAMADIGRIVGCCAETVRKCIRLLEAWGCLDTRNVFERSRAGVRRAANAYLLISPDDDAGDPAQPHTPDRWASALALAARPSGWLNTTAKATRGRPAPA